MQVEAKIYTSAIACAIFGCVSIKMYINKSVVEACRIVNIPYDIASVVCYSRGWRCRNMGYKEQGYN